MTRCITLALLFGTLLMGQTIQDFTRIYDAYLAAVKKGAYREVSAFFTKELKEEVKAPDDQDWYMTMAKLMLPVSYEPTFLTMTDGGQKADVQVIATINVPEDVQKEQNLPPTQRQELTLKFEKQDGQWKWAGSTMLGDPDQRARPKDLNMGSRSDYREGSHTQIGGQILRLEKQAAGTVYLIRMFDEEEAAFVPAAKVSSEFVAGRVLVLSGAEHKSDKLKFWADEASLQEQ
jgi:hypothetical protein